AHQFNQLVHAATVYRGLNWDVWWEVTLIVPRQESIDRRVFFLERPLSVAARSKAVFPVEHLDEVFNARIVLCEDRSVSLLAHFCRSRMDLLSRVIRANECNIL